jgi:hypothetical protein
MKARIGSIGTTFALVLILMGPFLLLHGDQSWHRDWHYFEHQAHVASLSLAEGAPADWNPWHCAGYDQAENPQSLSSSPLFVLVTLFGPGLGLRMACLLFLCLGAASMCWLLRREGLGKEACVFGGVLWGVLPFMGVHLSEGHVPFVGFALMPLALGLMKMATERGRSVPMVLLAGGVGAVLAGQLTFGGVYPFVFTTMLLGFYTLWRVSKARSAEAIIPLAVALTFGVLLGLPKILPALELMDRIPRVPLWTDSLTPSLFFDGLVSRSVDTSAVAGHPYHWPEYVFYPGLLLLALVCWGHWRERGMASKGLPALLFVLIGFLFMIGDFTLSPYRALSALPLVGDLQVPSRFAVFMLFGLVIWAAFAAETLIRSELLQKKWVLLILVLIVVENWSLSGQWLRGAPTDTQVAQGAVEAPMRVGPLQNADVRMDRAPKLRMVVSNCYEPGPMVVPPVLQGGQTLPFVRPAVPVRMEHPGQFRVQSYEPVVLSQVYRPNWRVSGGRVEASEDGLTRIIPEADEVVLEYENPARKRGLWAQLMTCVFGLGLFFWHRKRAQKA